MRGCRLPQAQASYREVDMRSVLGVLSTGTHPGPLNLVLPIVPSDCWDILVAAFVGDLRSKCTERKLMDNLYRQ